MVLCHKPGQLREVAEEVAPNARAVASILGATPVSALREAYPGVPVLRLIPSTPVEVRKGVVCMAAANGVDPELERSVEDLFAELGTLVRLPESQIDVAMALMSCAPAFWALAVEAQVDAGVRRGLTTEDAQEMVVSDDGRHRGAAARARHGHPAGAPRGHVARRLDRARARRARGGRPARRLRGGRRRGAGGGRAMTLILATARDDIAGYIETLVLVYTILIIAYILSTLIFSAGGRIPYARWSSGCSASCATSPSPTCGSSGASSRRSGPLDLSPIVAILVLQIVGGIVVEPHPRVSRVAPWSRAALLLAAVLAADQLTKALVRAGIEPRRRGPDPARA